MDTNQGWKSFEYEIFCENSKRNSSDPDFPLRKDWIRIRPLLDINKRKFEKREKNLTTTYLFISEILIYFLGMYNIYAIFQ